MKGIIYKATNKISNKVYIGQTIQTLSERIRQHYQTSKSNKNYHFMRALRFYEKDDWVWEVVEENIKRDKLNEREKYWIKYYGSFENGYNGNWGGQDSVKVSKIYKLWHPKKKSIEGTVLQLSKILKCHKINVYQLTSKAIDSVKGYMLFDNIENYKKKIEEKNKLYKFYRPGKRIKKMTITEFYKVSGIPKKVVYDFIEGKEPKLGCWTILEND